MNWWKLVICALFGYLGAHKFMEKQIGMGLLYLFTVGLFGIGWIVDTIRYLVIAFKGIRNKNIVMLFGAIWLLILVKAGMSVLPSEIVEVTPSPSVEIGIISSTMEQKCTPIIEEAVTNTWTVTETIAPTQKPTEKPIAEPTIVSTERLTQAPTDQPTVVPTRYEGHNYIVNKNSKIFHETYCGSVKKMKESNKIYFQGTREDAIEWGYKPCQNCNP